MIYSTHNYFFFTMKMLGRLASIKADKKKDAKVKAMKARKAVSKAEERARGLQRSGSMQGKRASYNTGSKTYKMK